MSSLRIDLLSAAQQGRLARRFIETGRLELPGFVSQADAAALHADLAARNDWRLVMNASDRVFELSRDAVAAMTLDQRDELDRRVVAAGRYGFQYRYETIRVPDAAAERQEAPSPLTRFVEAMGTVSMLNALGAITGTGDLRFADGQATAYSSGHFLTRHNDDVAGKNRRLAYVLGLSPDWRVE